MVSTHEVLNQPPPPGDVNLFARDAALIEGVKREGAAWAVEDLSACGARAGSAAAFERGRLANRHSPILHTHDRFGHRLDMVEFHPAWHETLGVLVEEGVHCSAWSDPQPGAHVARAAKMLMLGQPEAGALCPATMTFGSVPALRQATLLAASWLPKLFSRHYDPRFRPIGEKTGCLIGMGLTEKQGGSDVRANQTRAEPAGNGDYLLTGHKWFLSVPMSDAFLVTAQAPGGITCFFLPRFTPDGQPNAIRLMRLKDKLGNRSNASSEVEFDNAWAIRVGEEGRGIPTILEMGNHTRLDCALGSTALLRQATSRAIFHAAHRTAFQRRLIDQPLMRNVLADLALETEAAIALCLRMARGFDASTDDAEQALRRLLTPAAKYWICKRGPTVAAEAMEVLGGNGYVEDSDMPRIYREAPVNSIWEGSGNVMCLDVLRVLGKSPGAVEALRAELAAAEGADARFDRFAAKLAGDLVKPDEASARRLTERLVLAVQAALLLRHAPGAVADAFCATRLDGDWGYSLGTLPDGSNVTELLARAAPEAV